MAIAERLSQNFPAGNVHRKAEEKRRYKRCRVSVTTGALMEEEVGRHEDGRGLRGWSARSARSLNCS